MSMTYDQTNKNNLFGCRIFTVEYSMGSQLSNDHINTSLCGHNCIQLCSKYTILTKKYMNRVPIIHIFGTSKHYINVCLNIHEFYPYFYINWPPSLFHLFDKTQIQSNKGILYPNMTMIRSSFKRLPKKPPFLRTEDMLHALALHIDAYISTHPTLSTQYNNPCVFNIEVVYRRSIYGYQVNREPFLKISLLNMRHIHEVASFLHTTGFYGVHFQPYDVHLIGLQCFMDLNLQGMNYIWVPRDHLCVCESHHTRQLNYIADLNIHCRQSSICNTFQTVVSPDNYKDLIALSQSQELIIVKNHISHQTDLTEPRIVSQLNVFLQDIRVIRKLCGSSCHSNMIWDTPILSWKDPWPYDYDDLHAPPIATSLEYLWNDEIKRREHYRLPLPQSLYDQETHQSIQRQVISSSQMLEQHIIQALKEFFPNEWTQWIPKNQFASEDDLLHYLKTVQTQCLIAYHPMKLQDLSSVIKQRLPHYPLYSDPNDLSRTYLSTYLRRYQQTHISTKQTQQHMYIKHLFSVLKTIEYPLMQQKTTLKSLSQLYYYHLPPPTLQSIQQRYHLSHPAQLMDKLEKQQIYQRYCLYSSQTGSSETSAIVFNSTHHQHHAYPSIDKAGHLIISPNHRRKKVYTDLQYLMTELNYRKKHVRVNQFNSQSNIRRTKNKYDKYHHTSKQRSAPQLMTLCSSKQQLPILQPFIPITKKKNQSNNYLIQSHKKKYQTTRRYSFFQLFQCALKRRVLDQTMTQQCGREQPMNSMCRSLGHSNITPDNIKSNHLSSSIIPTTVDQNTRLSHPQSTLSTSTRISVQNTELNIPMFSQSCLESLVFEEGLQFGRCLGFEVLTDIQSHRQGDFKTFGQIKQESRNPMTDTLLSIIYICRIQISHSSLTDLIYLEKCIQKNVPGQNHFFIDKYSTLFNTKTQHTQFLDFQGIIMVCQDPTQSWPIISIPYSKETYRFKQVTNPLLSYKETIQLHSNVVQYIVPTEYDLIYCVMHQLFRIFDPSVILGFDTFGGSIGYFIRRAELLGFNNISSHLGRLPPVTPLTASNLYQHSSSKPKNKLLRVSGNVGIPGRLIYNIGRHLKEEIKSSQASLHYYASTVLSITFPLYPLFTLSQWWWASQNHNLDSNITQSDHINPWPLRHRSLFYVLRYLQLTLKLFDSADLLTRSAEIARCLGIDLSSAISRGSQYRIEALLSRAAHGLGYVMLTASKLQVKNQRASVCLPLVLEPKSGFYWWPVIVLDFQSLYPSIMIAYNICYSTCLGQFTQFLKQSTKNEFKQTLGVHEINVPLNYIKANTDDDNDPQPSLPIYITPDGTVYVTRRVRRGLIPSLLEKVISLRIAIKETMKLLESPTLHLSENRKKNLIRILGYRQYALKMFANCTYGYTSASYSGRMPCSEIADSVVQIARRMLERSMTFIENHSRWNAKIIYGDTDSLFVYLHGRTVKEAFSIGKEIVKEISNINPWPVQLNLEKIYSPCCLQTKKRYVGYCYENEDSIPYVDSKGIETIRRDQCPIVSHALSNALKTLFQYRDVSITKKQLRHYWLQMLLLEPYSSLSDLIFIREVKLGSYAYDFGKPSHTLPPQAVVSYRMLQDWSILSEQMSKEFSLFEYRQRIPYMIIKGEPRSRLIDLVVPPYKVFGASQPLCPLSPTLPHRDVIMFQLWEIQQLFHVNTEWYIKHQIIPVVQRLLGLIHSDIDIMEWYTSLNKISPSSNLHRKRRVRCNNIDESYKADHPQFKPNYLTSIPVAEFNKQTPTEHSIVDEEHDVFDIAQIVNEEELDPTDQITLDPQPDDINDITNDSLFKQLSDKSIHPIQPTHNTIQDTIKDITVQSNYFISPNSEQHNNNPLYINQDNHTKTTNRVIESSTLPILQKRKYVLSQRVKKSTYFVSPIPMNTLTTTNLKSLLSPFVQYCRICGISIKNRKKNPVKSFPTTISSLLQTKSTTHTTCSSYRYKNKFKSQNIQHPLKQRTLLSHACRSQKTFIKKNQNVIKTPLLPQTDHLTTTLRHEILYEFQQFHQYTPNTVIPIREQLENVICLHCCLHIKESIWKIHTKLNNTERRYSQLLQLCIHCTGNLFSAESCHDAFYCPIYTAKIQARDALHHIIQDIEDICTCQ